MKRYEYNYLWFGGCIESTIKELNEYGEEGWKFVCQIEDDTILLMRELPKKEVQ